MFRIALFIGGQEFMSNPAQMMLQARWQMREVRGEFAK
jgi:hypothetical protein